MESASEVANKITFKWICVPYSILVVVAAASSYNLFEEFDKITASQGYDKSAKEYILFTVFLGYFGLFPGIFVHHFGNKWTFSIAAILALIGYGGLGFFASFKVGSGAHLAGTLLCLAIAGFSSSIVIVTAIGTPVENFTIRASMLSIILFIVYYHMANAFEYSLRHSVFSDIRPSVYYPILGVFLCLIYLMSLVLIKEIVIENKYQRPFVIFDKTGILIFILIEFILLVTIYIIYMIKSEYKISSLVFSIFLLVNFAVLILIAKFATSSLEEKAALTTQTDEEIMHVDFKDILTNLKFYGMLISSLIMIGTTWNFKFNLTTIKYTTYQSVNVETYYDVFWISEGLASLISGLLTFQFRHYVNEYIWGIAGSLLAAIGFILGAIAENNVAEFLYVGTLLIAIAGGIWWVMAPLIAFDDAGQFSFGALFGTILTFNFWGVFIYGIVWSVIWDHVEKPLFAIYLVFAISCGFSIATSMFSFLRDEKTA